MSTTQLSFPFAEGLEEAALQSLVCECVSVLGTLALQNKGKVYLHAYELDAMHQKLVCLLECLNDVRGSSDGAP